MSSSSESVSPSLLRCDVGYIHCRMGHQQLHRYSYGWFPFLTYLMLWSLGGLLDGVICHMSQTPLTRGESTLTSLVRSGNKAVNDIVDGTINEFYRSRDVKNAEKQSSFAASTTPHDYTEIINEPNTQGDQSIGENEVQIEILHVEEADGEKNIDNDAVTAPQQDTQSNQTFESSINFKANMVDGHSISQPKILSTKTVEQDKETLHSSLERGRNTNAMNVWPSGNERDYFSQKNRAKTIGIGYPFLSEKTSTHGANATGLDESIDNPGAVVAKTFPPIIRFSSGFQRKESKDEETQPKIDDKTSSPQQVSQENTKEGFNSDQESEMERNGMDVETINKSNLSPNKIEAKSEANPPPPICSQAMNCNECLKLSLINFKQSLYPCYWQVFGAVLKCVSTEEKSEVAGAITEAYKCADNDYPIYTGEKWSEAISAMDDTNSVSINDEKGGVTHDTEVSNESTLEHIIPSGGYNINDEEADGIFEMLKSTFNVLLLAALFASILIIRKRVLIRSREDPSLDMAKVVKEEVLNFLVSIASHVVSFVSSVRASGNDISETRQNESIGRLASFGREQRNSYERETIPLSTAADEEWGWNGDDMSPNLELAGVGVDDIKEEEELALAIAMSLSESSSGSDKDVISKSTQSDGNFAQRKKNYQPKTMAQEFLSTDAAKSTESELSSLGKRDSIEDLLGQISSNGGPGITSFRHSGTKAHAKPKQALSDVQPDDIFMTMGLSSFTSKMLDSAVASRPPLSGSKHISEQRLSTPVAPRSAKSPTLSAVNDGDADWGDDGDLDDLLDD